MRKLCPTGIIPINFDTNLLTHEQRLKDCILRHLGENYPVSLDWIAEWNEYVKTKLDK